MEYIIIIFFIIFILYSYLYEYYDVCQIKNCNKGYFLQNNICFECEGDVTPNGKDCCTNYIGQKVKSYNNDCTVNSCNDRDIKTPNGKSCCKYINDQVWGYDDNCKVTICGNSQDPTKNCVCNFPDDSIIKSAAVEFYKKNNNNYIIEPQFINKVNDNNIDISYTYKSTDGQYGGIGKRRFTFYIDNSNCSFNITNMGEDGTGITVTDAKLDNYYLLQQAKSNKCVENNNDENIFLNTCDTNNNNQYWSNNYNLLKNKKSGKCLDSDGTNFYFNNCDKNNSYQNFIKERGEINNLYKHKSSGKCLDGDYNGNSDKKQIYFNNCNSYNTNQNWYLDANTVQQYTPPTVIKDPYGYNLFKFSQNSMCLDIDNNNNLLLNNCDENLPSQLWSNVDNLIKNKKTNKCLSVNTNIYDDNVFLNDCNINDNYQKFTKIKKNYGNQFRFSNGNGNKAGCLNGNVRLDACTDSYSINTVWSE